MKDKTKQLKEQRNKEFIEFAIKFAKDKPQTKKDRLFIIVMAIIVANLTYILLQVVPYLVMEGYGDFRAWAIVIANIMGITGALWLVREERKRRRNIDK